MSDLGYYSCKADPDVWMSTYTNTDGNDFMSTLSCMLTEFMYKEQATRGDFPH